MSSGCRAAGPSMQILPRTASRGRRVSVGDFAVYAEPVDAGIALCAQLVRRQFLEVIEMADQRRLDAVGGGLRIAMRAAHGLGQHFVDQLEPGETVGRQA